MSEQTLIDKIRQLPPERLAEVEDFVDFLSELEERRLVRAATQLSEAAFERVWNGDAEASYETAGEPVKTLTPEERAAAFREWAMSHRDAPDLPDEVIRREHIYE